MKFTYSLVLPLVATATSAIHIDNLIKRDCETCLDAALYLANECPLLDPEEILQCTCNLQNSYFEDLLECYQTCATVDGDFRDSQSAAELKAAICQGYDLEDVSDNSSTSGTAGSVDEEVEDSVQSESADVDTSSTQAESSSTISAADSSSENAAVGLGGAGSFVYLLAVALL